MKKMTLIEVLFVALAFVGLVGTGVQLPAYFKGDFFAGNLEFWKDTVATPSGTFLLVDIFVFGAVVLTWMFGECRRLRLGPGWAWAYFFGSALIGISFAMPLFFAHRQWRLRQQLPDQVATPAGADFIAIVFLLACVAVAAAYSLSHQPGA